MDDIWQRGLQIIEFDLHIQNDWVLRYVSTVHWSLQGTRHGDSNGTFTGWDTAKVLAEHAAEVLGYTCCNRVCT